MPGRGRMPMGRPRTAVQAGFCTHLSDVDVDVSVEAWATELRNPLKVGDICRGGKVRLQVGQGKERVHGGRGGEKRTIGGKFGMQ